MQKKVALYTLGCKLNYSETSTIGRQLTDAGYRVVKFDDVPDVFVFNTCSVTDMADKKSRKIIRQALRVNPNALIVVTGCYAQLKPEEIANIKGVDLVLGANEKFNILRYLQNFGAKADKGEVHSCEIDEVNTFTNAFSFGDRTRSFLKIQDGCDYKCTYCTIPKARGGSRSGTVGSVVADAKLIAARGIKEIVLTGVNIGDFGKGTEVIEGLRTKKDDLFIDLIRALDEVEGIERCRISSIEPNLLTPEIIEFSAQAKRFVPHFHIPLQSGSDKMLTLMKRRYKRDLYSSRVALVKKSMPHACVGVDVIIGFPGESEEDFMDTYRFLNELDVSYLHVFTYSERPGTEAAVMPDKVSPGEKKRRSKMLQILSEKKKRFFYEQFVGKEATVLFEKRKASGQMSGFTENYIQIVTDLNPNKLNTLGKVKMTGINDEGIMEAVVLE